MNLMDNHTKISIVFGILILILHLINEYLLNYNFIITILMFIILIILAVLWSISPTTGLICAKAIFIIMRSHVGFIKLL